MRRPFFVSCVIGIISYKFVTTHPITAFLIYDVKCLCMNNFNKIELLNLDIDNASIQIYITITI